jgi:hypothetical protein
MELLMDKCTQERIQIASLRTGITAAAGIGLWFLSGWLAHKYGVNLAIQGQIGISLVGFIGMWFATKPMFSFTEECILMQEATSARSKPASKVYLPQGRLATATPKIRAASPTDNTPPATLAAGTLFAQGRITVEVTRPEASPAQITVTVTGLSASEFKGNNGNGGFRQRLESISGISWENPKNLGNGKRTITGAVKSSNEGELAAKLKETASRYAGR